MYIIDDIYIKFNSNILLAVITNQLPKPLITRAYLDLTQGSVIMKEHCKKKHFQIYRQPYNNPTKIVTASLIFQLFKIICHI